MDADATVRERLSTFSVRDVPFSFPGSWMNISPRIAEGMLEEDLHLVSHRTGFHPVLRLTALGPERVSIRNVVATPAELSYRIGAGVIDVAFETPDVIRLRGNGLSLRLAAVGDRLSPFAGSYFYQDPVDQSYGFALYGTGRRYRITMLHGRAQPTGLAALGAAERSLLLSASAGAVWEAALEELPSAGARYATELTYDVVAVKAAETFTQWLDDVAGWRTAATPGVSLAAYVLWSATVAPDGFVGRPAILMSKHWMDKVWSWDHCFNALALAPGDPELAWHQYRLIFDHKDDAGGLPDSVAHSEVLYNFQKPPVHGLVLSLLLDRLPRPPDDDELECALADLERWTEWWCTYRRAPGHCLPHYQHGNDSGWDNATAFDAERPVETAELAALLAIQMYSIADLARHLGHPERADEWTARGESLQQSMLDELWNGRAFDTRGVVSGIRRSSRSLLQAMPIVLGRRLPSDVVDALEERLNEHLTGFGLATEPPDSPNYQSDGYWRGPIWAPSTYLVILGLRDAGRDELADIISDRYRAMCETAGYAENFDALTGQGLRDLAYTWTASCYLLLAEDHEKRTRAGSSAR